MLLELCRLRCWAAAGMSIDYVKRLDLIHQAAVLALVSEPGMDPGTCRALAAMYEQLCRAFKVADGLGSWWRATNGILQGCPLSVIVVNVLTMIWKWEIDSLRLQVYVPTAVLPLALAPKDMNFGDERDLCRRRRWNGVVGVHRRHLGNCSRSRDALGHVTDHGGMALGQG